MKALAWLIAIILIPLTVLASLFIVLDFTVLNSPFVKSQLLKTDIYTDAAAYLPEQLLVEQQMSNQEKIETTAKLQSVITPVYLQEQVEKAVDQAEAVLHRTSTSISLSLADSVERLQTAGLPIGDDMAQPFTFSLAEKPEVQQALQLAHLVRLIAYVATVVLVVLLFILLWQTKAFSSLATLTVILFLIEVGLFIAVTQLPMIVKNNLSPDDQVMAHFLPKIQLFVTNVSSSLSMFFAGMAVLALVIAIISIVLAHRESKKVAA